MSVQMWRSEAPILERGAFFITPYDEQGYNRLGGRLTIVAPEGATAEAVVLEGEEGLLFSYRKEPETTVGFKIQLYDSKVDPEERTYLHIGAATTLAFEMRVSAGADDVVIHIADRNLERREAWREVGPAETWATSTSLDESWQEVQIPVSALPANVDPEILASLVFTVSAGTDGRVQLRNLALLDQEGLQGR